jgi:HD-GYP domain-containing protein (c-di-GMP phosphodiesterase class II)
MVVAKDIVDKYGRVLISEGMILKQELIVLLKKHEISKAWVKLPAAAEDEIDATKMLVNSEMKSKLIAGIRDIFSSPCSLDENLQRIQAYVEEITTEITHRKDVLLYLSDLHYTSDYLFMHSVNVGIFAIVIGTAMQLTFNELCVLGMGGILHDLGKAYISNKILDKKERLAVPEFNQIKEHSLLGYNMLKGDAKIDHRISLIALQHHERINGSGYPWGVMGHQIHPFSRIVAVADVYDALTTDRVYRTRLTSQEAINIINEGAACQYDAQVLEAFSQVVIPYHIGNNVSLSNGLRGKVIRLNRSNLVRPCVLTAKGIINLLQESELSIVSVS